MGSTEVGEQVYEIWRGGGLWDCSGLVGAWLRYVRDDDRQAALLQQGPDQAVHRHHEGEAEPPRLHFQPCQGSPVRTAFQGSCAKTRRRARRCPRDKGTSVLPGNRLEGFG